MSLPDLPNLNEDPWFEKRTAWDNAVRQRLEDLYSDVNQNKDDLIIVDGLLKEKQEQLELNLAAARDKVDGLSDTIAQLSLEFPDVQADLTALEGTLSDLDAALSQGLGDLDGELAGLSEKLDTDLGALNTSLSQRMSGLEGDLGDLDVALGGLPDALAQLEQDLSGQVASAQAEADAAKLSAASAQADATAARSEAATAQSKADSAYSDASAAQGAADAAAQAAANAAGVAEAKADVLIQSTAPPAAMRKATTLWIDTTGGNNTPKRWTSGTTWVAVTDKAATDAANAAVAAQNTANKAVTDAATAKSAADTAQAAALGAQNRADAAHGLATTADGRITVATANPTAANATGKPIGAIWEVRSGGVALRRYVLTGTSTWTQIKVGQDFIGNNAIGSAQIADLAVGTSQIADSAITNAKIGNATIETAKIKDGAITNAKINDLSAGKINAGTLNANRIGGRSITAGKLAANTITANEIAANTLTANEIAADAITASELAANSVQAGHITSNAVTTAKLDAKAVTAAKISANAIIAEHVKSGEIKAGHLAANSVSADKIVANAITGDKIAANSILAKNLVLTDFSNLLPDPTFEARSSYGVWGTPFVRNNVRGIAKYGTGTQTGTYYPEWQISTTEGDSFFFEMNIERIAGTTSTVAMYVRQRNAAGTIVTTTAPINTTATGRVTGQLTITDASVVSLEPGLYTQIATPTSTRVFVSQVKVHRRTSAELLVDGAVTARSIAANAVTAQKIDSEALNFKSATGLEITSGSFNTSTLSNRGVRIDSSGIQGWNASGARRLFVQASTGSIILGNNAVSISGTTGNVTINGGVFADGEVRSGASTSNSVYIRSDVHQGRPGIVFDTGSTAQLQPLIQSMGVGSGGYDAGTLLITGREQTTNSTGRASIRLKHNGGFDFTQEYGTHTGIGISQDGYRLDISGAVRTAVGARRTFLQGRAAVAVGGSATLTYGSPAPIGTRRPFAQSATTSQLTFITTNGSTASQVVFHAHHANGSSGWNAQADWFAVWAY